MSNPSGSALSADAPQLDGPDSAKLRAIQDRAIREAYNLGRKAIHAGRYREAAAILARANPFGRASALDDDILYRHALALVASGDCAAARKAFEELLTRYPGGDYSVRAEFGLCECLQKAGDYQSAAAGYQEFLQDHPKSYLADEALMNLGDCALAVGDHPTAAKAFSRLVDEATSSAQRQSARRKLRVSLGAPPDA